MNKYLKLFCLIFLIFISCSEEENLSDDNSDDSRTIYASKGPYFFKASSDCSQNLTDLQDLINNAVSLNKRLVIEKDTYCINGTLLIPSNLEIDFSGAIIEREVSLSHNQDDAIVFDMIRNNNMLGNTNIIIKNLIIDGNYPEENLSLHHENERFSGLEFNNSNNIILENIDVIETVNGEQSNNPPSAGIFINSCENINCKNINGYNNNGTAIILNNSDYVTIDGSITKDNAGTGVGSSKSNYCNYLNITSSNNGLEFYGTSMKKYSNVSINGSYCKVSNITTSDATGSGLNIGHVGTNPSDFTIVDNVHSYENILDGITISGSKQILLSNIHLEKNARNNLYIASESSKVQINNAIIHGYYNKNGLVSGNNGIRITYGGGHSINNSLIYDNYFNGIGVYGVSGGVSIGSETYIYNNGRDISNPIEFAGIRLDTSQNCYINGVKIYSDQQSGSKTQDYGVKIIGGGSHHLIYNEIWGNLIKDIDTTNTSNNQIVN